MLGRSNLRRDINVLPWFSTNETQELDQYKRHISLLKQVLSTVLAPGTYESLPSALYSTLILEIPMALIWADHHMVTQEAQAYAQSYTNFLNGCILTKLLHDLATSMVKTGGWMANKNLLAQHGFRFTISAKGGLLGYPIIEKHHLEELDAFCRVQDAVRTLRDEKNQQITRPDNQGRTQTTIKSAASRSQNERKMWKSAMNTCKCLLELGKTFVDGNGVVQNPQKHLMEHVENRGEKTWNMRYSLALFLACPRFLHCILCIYKVKGADQLYSYYNMISGTQSLSVEHVEHVYDDLGGHQAPISPLIDYDLHSPLPEVNANLNALSDSSGLFTWQPQLQPEMRQFQPEVRQFQQVQQIQHEVKQHQPQIDQQLQKKTNLLKEMVDKISRLNADIEALRHKRRRYKQKQKKASLVINAANEKAAAILKNARTKADKIIKVAKKTAKDIVQNARTKADKIKGGKNTASLSTKVYTEHAVY